MARVRYDSVSGEKWPKLKRDWVGRHVRLHRTMETKGGTIFEKDNVMLVTRNFSGLELESVKACAECRSKCRYFIKHVRESEVTLLPEDFKPLKVASFRVQVGDLMVECDSAADVAALARMQEAG